MIKAINIIRYLNYHIGYIIWHTLKVIFKKVYILVSALEKYCYHKRSKYYIHRIRDGTKGVNKVINDKKLVK